MKSFNQFLNEFEIEGDIIPPTPNLTISLVSDRELTDEQINKLKIMPPRLETYLIRLDYNMNILDITISNRNNKQYLDISANVVIPYKKYPKADYNKKINQFNNELVSMIENFLRLYSRNNGFPNFKFASIGYNY